MTPAESRTTATAEIRVDAHRRVGRIAEEVYGHFLEQAFFGNIEGGVFDEGSPLSLAGPGARDGLRADVIDLCRELGVRVVRWPGGNFASPYHWTDGIGPRDQRPRRLELAWGTEETNRFGTDEFLTWCEEIGAEAYLAHSCRDVDEAVRWVEYTNYAGSTHYADARAANGHPEPYRVRYWGIGNETFGPWQMGYRTGEEYGRSAREHARFMREVDPTIKTIGVGDVHDQQWNHEVLKHAGRMLDYLSLHLYAASTHLFTGDDYDAVVAQSVYFEQGIQGFARTVTDQAAALGLDRPPALVLDEWNVRHIEPAAWPEPEASPEGGIAPRELPDRREEGPVTRDRVNRWSPRTLADALCYAGIFHAIHRASGLAAAPTMANPVNLLNANGIIVARPGGAVRSAAYHVWDLYGNHTGRDAVPVEVDGPSRFADIRQGHRRDHNRELITLPGTVPDLDVSATLADDGSLRLAVINRHRDRAIHTRLRLDGRDDLPPTAHALQFGADVDDLHAGNDLTAPDRVALRDLGDVPLTDGGCTFPAHSITLLTIARS